jgi:ketosteroid isomerase-like protein
MLEDEVTFRMRVMATAILLVMGSVLGAQEPVKPPLSPRITTATRQVSTFSALEKQLLAAVQKKDAAAVRSLLSEEFALHLPDSDVMSAEDWMASVMSKDYELKSFIVRQVDVADLGDAALVSYDRVQDSTFNGQSDGGEFFVTDLWRKDGDKWKLSDRYVTKVGSTPYMPKADVKPSGKN